MEVLPEPATRRGFAPAPPSATMRSASLDQRLPAVLTRAENLPSLPAVAVEVLRLCQDESATIQDLAATIARDPALAAKLLKVSNSSLFNLGQEVTTLERATMERWGMVRAA